MFTDLQSELRYENHIWNWYSPVDILPLNKNSEFHILSLSSLAYHISFSLFLIAKEAILKQALLCMHNKNP